MPTSRRLTAIALIVVVIDQITKSWAVSALDDGHDVQYGLQVTNPQVANDEISVWIRRNGAAYPNTLRQFSTGAVGVKNFLTGQLMMLFGEDDYLELFFSVKHNQTQLLKTSSLTNPSRPATPSAQILLYRIQ